MVPKELSEAMNYVPTEYVVYTTIVVIALVIACIKFFPILKSWFEAARTKVNTYEELQKMINNHTEQINGLKDSINDINDKMGNDYRQIKQIREMTVKQQKYIDDSMEERELIVRSLLGIIQGLQELGANGPTKAAESDIKEYMVKKSHEVSKLNFDE